eukprot:TRINITY_DN57471_c0_g1_i1.p1 TRINITY_DN57471_c0_g1~~TRINITY_DN57471_c0_g1_i1.p1  ORF type:complete len:843 (+),score=52.74 TRINITY_DN57471_c0_g1_i1:64-2592(+)
MASQEPTSSVAEEQTGEGAAHNIQTAPETETQSPPVAEQVDAQEPSSPSAEPTVAIAHPTVEIVEMESTPSPGSPSTADLPPSSTFGTSASNLDEQRESAEGTADEAKVDEGEGKQEQSATPGQKPEAAAKDKKPPPGANKDAAASVVPPSPELPIRSTPHLIRLGRQHPVPEAHPNSLTPVTSIDFVARAFLRWLQTFHPPTKNTCSAVTQLFDGVAISFVLQIINDRAFPDLWQDLSMLHMGNWVGKCGNLNTILQSLASFYKSTFTLDEVDVSFLVDASKCTRYDDVDQLIWLLALMAGTTAGLENKRRTILVQRTIMMLPRTDQCIIFAIIEELFLQLEEAEKVKLSKKSYQSSFSFDYNTIEAEAKKKVHTLSGEEVERVFNRALGLRKAKPVYEWTPRSSSPRSPRNSSRSPRSMWEVAKRMKNVYTLNYDTYGAAAKKKTLQDRLNEIRAPSRITGSLCDEDNLRKINSRLTRMHRLDSSTAFSPPSSPPFPRPTLPAALRHAAELWQTPDKRTPHRPSDDNKENKAPRRGTVGSRVYSRYAPLPPQSMTSDLSHRPTWRPAGVRDSRNFYEKPDLGSSIFGKRMQSEDLTSVRGSRRGRKSIVEVVSEDSHSESESSHVESLMSDDFKDEAGGSKFSASAEQRELSAVYSDREHSKLIEPTKGRPNSKSSPKRKPNKNSSAKHPASPKKRKKKNNHMSHPQGGAFNKLRQHYARVKSKVGQQCQAPDWVWWTNNVAQPQTKFNPKPGEHPSKTKRRLMEHMERQKLYSQKVAVMVYLDEVTKQQEALASREATPVPEGGVMNDGDPPTWWPAVVEGLCELPNPEAGADLEYDEL